MKKYNFKGIYGDEDQRKAWENFHVCLLGEEVGEVFTDGPKNYYSIRKILKASGYELILRKVKK